MDLISLEVESYLNEDPIAIKCRYNISNFLTYWKIHGEKEYPYVAKAAKKVLGISATSAPSEKTGSLIGRVLAKQRTSLKPETVSNLIAMKNLQQFVPENYSDL